MEKMLIATIIVAALLGNACLQAEAMEKVSPAAGVITMATTQTGEEFAEPYRIYSSVCGTNDC